MSRAEVGGTNRSLGAGGEQASLVSTADLSGPQISTGDVAPFFVRCYVRDGGTMAEGAGVIKAAAREAHCA
jgi:hypothetical protein